MLRKTIAISSDNRFMFYENQYKNTFFVLDRKQQLTRAFSSFSIAQHYYNRVTK